MVSRRGFYGAFRPVMPDPRLIHIAIHIVCGKEPQMKILDVVDMQRDFVRESGALPVPGAHSLIDPVHDLFDRLPDKVFDLALFKYDTHFPAEYPHSPEAEKFPDIHCAYGTDGWDLAVDPARLGERVHIYYMAKNMFDMWAENPVGRADELDFSSQPEEEAYRNLYHITSDQACREAGVHRDEFLKNIGVGSQVVMLGVASNFCVQDALTGYLEKGARVEILRDLTCGIPLDGQAHKQILAQTGIDRTTSGGIDEVVMTRHFDGYLDSGQLQLINYQDWLEKS